MNELRQRQLERIGADEFDTLVIGGGINGAVSAASLAARGVSVAMVDRGDFAGFTSQESSNLVWGGFKYLQTYEFSLVRKLCLGRNRLIDAFPSSITPIDFLAVFDEQAPFPGWLAAAGSYAYWGIGNFQTRPPRPLTPRAVRRLEPVIETAKVTGGLRYADAYLQDNDARFVFGFVNRARQLGAAVANYTEVTAVEWDGRVWSVELADRVDGSTRTLRARSIVNATGPFLDDVNAMLGVSTRHRVAHSKGIHLVVPRIGTGANVLAFFDEDERLYYVIPMGDRSVVGTTDTSVESPYTEVTDEDRDFVIRQVNARLDPEQRITTDSIISERCGVRPLVVEANDDNPDAGDWLQLSRKHEIEVDADRHVVSIFGGKLTDCLNVGEEVGDAIERCDIRIRRDAGDWFGESEQSQRVQFLRHAAADGRISRDHAIALWRRYDLAAWDVLERIAPVPSMVSIEPPYAIGELRYVAEHELVVTTEDFLRRRSALSQVTPEAELTTMIGDIADALGVARTTAGVHPS